MPPEWKICCPRCGRSFDNQMQVQRHLDQPRSRCNQPDVQLLDPEELLRFQRHTRVDAQSRIPFPQRAFHATRRDELDSTDLETGEDTVSSLDSDSYLNDTDSDTLATDYFEGAAKVVDRNGRTFMKAFDEDQFASIRELENLYYPFSDRAEWDFAEFLLTSCLSMADIDRFLSLKLVKRLGLSFQTAARLRSLAEMLPKTPPWKCRTIDTAPHQTKNLVRLFYRDTVECLQSLLSNPLFANSIDFSPYRVFTTAERFVRVYKEWMSCDHAWQLQEQLPAGASLLGVILSSDKTNITNQSGGKVAHPLLMSLANIHSAVRSKASLHAFLPIAFLPIAKFIHRDKRMKGVLSDRLYHQCLDIVMEPLKIAARMGIMLSDPIGNSRYCFTLLAGCIVDTPEACLIACVRGKTSPVTLADYTQFGDDVRHPERTKEITLAHISSIDTDPNDLVAFFNACAEHRLNGVHLPFWRNWLLSEPPRFLPPEVLHLFHRFWYDHDAAWCIHAVGADEIDFRFAVLQPITGHRHFSSGITALKQVTGKTQRDLQRYIIAVIAGAAPADVIRAVRALLEFRYLAQAPIINDEVCRDITAALVDFHSHKHSIINAGARCGEKGNVLDHWQIPKLEIMQSVAPNIPLIGPPIHWTADVTERAHIDFVKIPAAATNNNDYESQICRFLDRVEKCRTFSLALHLREDQSQLSSRLQVGLSPVLAPDDCPEKDSQVSPRGCQSEGEHSNLITDYFKMSSHAGASHISPRRTFINGPVAFHLNYDPAIGSININDVAERYSLPDLRAALVHYIYRDHDGHPLQIGGQRRYRSDERLPFEKLQVWYKVRLQQKSYHDSTILLPPQTLNAHPPMADWPKGRYDAAFINVNERCQWPWSGLDGHVVCEIRLIFRPIPSRGQSASWWSNNFLVYATRFDVQGNDPVTGMQSLKRAMRSNGIAMGDIFPLNQLRALAPIVPKFGSVADVRLTSRTSSPYSTYFYLNHFFEKDLYYAIRR